MMRAKRAASRISPILRDVLNPSGKLNQAPMNPKNAVPYETIMVIALQLAAQGVQCSTPATKIKISENKKNDKRAWCLYADAKVTTMN
ncbi:MAG: hypothetical protein NMNS02_02330 [Nitrosomonas sp.]|nr:MAG: hypothetical protein NMNS02_02330 [Nitrosomonas sp.]